MKPYTLYKAGSIGFWLMAALMIHQSHRFPEALCLAFSFAFLLAHQLTSWLIRTVEDYDELTKSEAPVKLPTVR